MIELYSYQTEAINKLHTGSILCGGVGSGKSITSLAYYITKVCGGKLNSVKPLKNPKDLYIITTARKRDSLEWEEECSRFLLSKDQSNSFSHIKLTIDSWNNIHKYKDVQGEFFIFDEQRVVGSGAWAKTFVKIAHRNDWILLSATPGDTWIDYIPVFVANRFYKNPSQFKQEHVVYNRFTKFPKVDRYLNVGKLNKLLKRTLVNMDFRRHTRRHYVDILTDFDKSKFMHAWKNRFNPYTNKPMKNVSEMCYALRRIVNSDPSRLESIRNVIKYHERAIIFYNFEYELDILRTLKEEYLVAEWNGEVHQPLPSGDKWVYLVQYTAGAEGWNCTETDTVIFFSLNYSYRATEQAAGRIDRVNTPYTELYYYMLKSNSMIDEAISKALRNKGKFNEKTLAF